MKVCSFAIFIKHYTCNINLNIYISNGNMSLIILKVPCHAHKS